MNSFESHTTYGSVKPTEQSSAPAGLVRRVLSTSLRTKLLIVFLAVALVPLVLLAFLNSRTAANTLEQNVGASIKALADTQAPVMGDLLDWQINRLQLFSQNPTLREAVQAANETYKDPATIRAEIDRLDKQWRAADAADNDADPLVHSRLVNPWADILRGYRDILPDNVEVFITDKYGAVVATTNRTSDYNQADEEWWIKAFNNGQGAIYVGQLDYDESSKAYASNIAVPVYGQDGTTVIGVLRTTLELTTLISTLELAKLGKTGYAELYFPGDLKLVRKNEKPAPADRDLVAQLEAHKDSAYFVTSLGGIPSLVSQAQVVSTNPARAAVIAKLGWTIVIHQERDESLSGVRTLTQNALLLSLTITALVAFTAVIGAQWLSRPIVQLTAVAREIASGNLQVQARQETGDEIGTLAGAFNSMIDQLRTLIGNLEQRVAERTAELQRRAVQLTTAAEVAQAASSILDPGRLLNQTVELVAARFNLYHVGLFLIDETGQWAVLQAASSEGGQRMLARQHRLQVGQVGIVGYVTGRGEPRVALDVGADAVFFDNPDLPDTRSEMALPLRARGVVIGALDVQSQEPEAFSPEDVTVFQTLADQIALAISNARLFQQAQESLEAERRAYGELSRQAWQKLTQTRPDLGFVSDQQGIVPIGDLWEPQMEQAVRAGEATPGDGDGSVLAIPIKVRGNVIGVIDAHKPGHAGQWTAEEAALMETLVEQLGTALESARLYQDTQRRAAQEQLISSITAHMRETLDIETVLQTAAREMRDVIGLAEVEVRVGTSPGSDATRRNVEPGDRKHHPA